MRAFRIASGLFYLPWAALAAQQVPGRDLLEFPLGTLERPAALRGGVGDGLGNPATIVLDSSARARIGAASLQTPASQGVSAQLLSVAIALPERLTVGLSLARYTVDDIVRTDTDPQTIGGPIPYGTTMYSATVAQQHGSHVAAGLAVRYRRGEMDTESRGAVGLDAGVYAFSLPYRDASVAVATFQWRPANAALERTAVNLAADLRVLGADTLREARVGYGLSFAEGSHREDFALGTARYRLWEARAGVARTVRYGQTEWRPRVAVGVQVDRYEVGVAREMSSADLGPVYQFSLNATLR